MVSTGLRMLTRMAGCMLALCVPLLGGCSVAGMLVSAASVATDSSVTWDIVKHLHAKITEGDAIPCWRLNTVQRALNPRCGAFVPGSLLASDIQNAQLQECPLAVVARDPQFWPALPEFVEKGARYADCTNSPLAELAALQSCPDFAAASPAVLQALQQLAETDSRAVHHDVVRMLSCPKARAAGLDAVLYVWLARGQFARGTLAFAPLGALHPDYLSSPLARYLEEQGHTAFDALGSYEGVQPRGFEEALRISHWVALQWWLSRVSGLANRVPPTQGNQLSWVPLARVLTPNFLADPSTQAKTVRFLISRGANPRQKLPFDPSKSVVEYARTLKSPLVGLLDSTVVGKPPALRQ